MAKNSFQEAIIYRVSTLAFFFSEIFSFIFIFYLWTSIYKQGGQIGNYELKDLILYYFVSNFLWITIKGTDIAWDVGDEIRMGQITNVLLRPMRYARYKFSQMLGGLAYRTSVFMVVFMLIGIFLSSYINFNIELKNILFFIIFFAIGYVINYFIFYTLGLTTFWLGLVRGFNFSLSVITGFMDGSVIPVDLLPRIVRNINDFLPFKYIIFTPVSVFNGKIQVTWETLVIPIAWIIVLYLLAKFVLNKGIKVYEGYGA